MRVQHSRDVEDLSNNQEAGLARIDSNSVSICALLDWNRNWLTILGCWPVGFRLRWIEELLIHGHTPSRRLAPGLNGTSRRTCGDGPETRASTARARTFDLYRVLGAAGFERAPGTRRI